MQWDIERYTAYGWKAALILELISRRYGRRLSHSCLAALRKGADCPRSCTLACPERGTPFAAPQTPWLDELERARWEEQASEYFRYDIEY